MYANKCDGCIAHFDRRYDSDRPRSRSSTYDHSRIAIGARGIAMSYDRKQINRNTNTAQHIKTAGLRIASHTTQDTSSHVSRAARSHAPTRHRHSNQNHRPISTSTAPDPSGSDRASSRAQRAAAVVGRGCARPFARRTRHAATPPITRAREYGKMPESLTVASASAAQRTRSPDPKCA